MQTELYRDDQADKADDDPKPTPSRVSVPCSHEHYRGENRWSSERRDQARLGFPESRQRKAKPRRKAIANIHFSVVTKPPGFLSVGFLRPSGSKRAELERVRAVFETSTESLFSM